MIRDPIHRHRSPVQSVKGFRTQISKCVTRIHYLTAHPVRKPVAERPSVAFRSHPAAISDSQDIVPAVSDEIKLGSHIGAARHNLPGMSLVPTFAKPENQVILPCPHQI